MKRKSILVLVPTMMLLCAANSYALPFSIEPTNPLPSKTVVGGTVFYTVTNNTSIVLSNNYVAYFPSNVAQVSNDPSVPNLCGAKFTLQPLGKAGDSCQLELEIVGPVVSDDCNDQKHHLFICASDETSCAGPTLTNSLNVNTYQQMAYIADDDKSNAITICEVDAAGAFIESSCNDHVDPTFEDPIDIIINNTSTMAYVANADNSNVPPYHVSVCPVTPTGSLEPCTSFTDTNFLLQYSGLRLNPANTFLYIANSNYPLAPSNNTVSICPVAANGQLENDTCFLDSGLMSDDVTPTFFQPNGRIAFNLSGTIAYIPNFASGLGASYVSICDVVQSGTNAGSFKNCIIEYGTPSTGPFTNLQGLDISPDGQYLYLANNYYDNRGNVVTCEIADDGHALENCSKSDGETTPPTPAKTFYFDTNSTNIFTNNTLLNYAYMPNGCVGNAVGNPPVCDGQSTTSICPMIDGGFGSCTTTTAGGLLETADSVWIANFLYPQ